LRCDPFRSKFVRISRLIGVGVGVVVGSLVLSVSVLSDTEEAA
jgi:hypothetical protein